MPGQFRRKALNLEDWQNLVQCPKGICRAWEDCS